MDDTGRITVPPMAAEARHDPDAELIHRRDMQNAAIYTEFIEKIVAEAPRPTAGSPAH
ncbi:hypothetical protein AB0B85_12150 [Micromonospora sp. NPDC049044]|uniref:hypothetical protein n=1 Tax=unclassified Micromonospora TaxID=2617518 RepID=UPI0033D72E9C